jgi:hypothetical protein
MPGERLHIGPRSVTAHRSAGMIQVTTAEFTRESGSITLPESRFTRCSMTPDLYQPADEHDVDVISRRWPTQ